MTPKERVKNTILRKEIDFLPYSFDLTGRIYEKVADYYGIEPGKVSEHIGDNLKYVCYNHASDFVPPVNNEHEYVDEFGIRWARDKRLRDIGDCGSIIEHPIKDDSMNAYRFPDPAAKGRYDHILGIGLENDDRYIILGMSGLFDLGCNIRGYENFLMDFSLNPDFVEEFLDKALEFNLGIIHNIPSFVDGIRFGEDWGKQKGLIMGPYYWRKYLKPRLKIMYQAARDRGLNVFIHSCGDIYEIIPDIIEIGVEVMHPVQPEAMDVASIKRNYGKDIVLYGGLGCQSTIPNGTREDVLKEARERVKLLGEDGGYIFGPAGAISTDVRVENVIALIEFAKNRYQG